MSYDNEQTQDPNTRLDLSAVEIITDLNSQMRALALMKEAVVTYFCKLNNLNPMDWMLAQDQRTLVPRQPDMAQMEDPRLARAIRR